MKVNIVQPQHAALKDVNVGQIFMHGCGIYIKTKTLGVVCLHKTAGRMQEEGCSCDIGPEAIVTLIVEATFIVGTA